MQWGHTYSGHDPVHVNVFWWYDPPFGQNVRLGEVVSVGVKERLMNACPSRVLPNIKFLVLGEPRDHFHAKAQTSVGSCYL